jgi:dihydrofolate reductase
MRKVIFGGANSLDNFFAGRDGGMDWLVWSDDVSKIMAEFWPRVDCVVMGRKTYETAMTNDAAGADGGDLYKGLRSYVFSRTWPAGAGKGGVEIVSEDAGIFVRKLKEQDGKDICVMGGGDLARSLFEQGVVDEIGLNIHPVLLGSGVPLFHNMSRHIDLELTHCRQLKGGCVYVSYRVKN